MILALLSWSLVVALGGACSRPTPTRVPTLPPPSPTIVAPTRSPTPSLNSAELFGTDEQEIQEAFTTQVLHVTDQAQYLAGGSCEKLGEALNDDPQMFSRIRGLAEILRRQYSKDQVLAQSAIQRVVADMDAAIGELNHTLSACGIGAGSSPG